MISIISISGGFIQGFGASSNVKTGSNKIEKAFVPKLPEKAINTKK